LPVAALRGGQIGVVEKSLIISEFLEIGCAF
jgi:hypothetical protein